MNKFLRTTEQGRQRKKQKTPELGHSLKQGKPQSEY